MLDIQSLPCLGWCQPGRIWAQTVSVAAAKVGMLLIRRFSASGSPPAQASLRFARAWARASLERDEREAAESGFAAAPADDEPLYAAARAGGLDIEVQAVAVTVAAGLGDVSDEVSDPARERLVDVVRVAGHAFAVHAWSSVPSVACATL